MRPALVLIAERYRIIERLGSGGMASVHLAEDETLGRRVALKRLHVGTEPDVTRRFEREARLGASVQHPGVVSVYDVLPEEDGVTLVLEYIQGEPLSSVIARGRVPPARALDILRQLASALDYLHAQGIVHRDVKPANVLIRHDGVVKLADLGIAIAPDLSRVTRTGTPLGTLAYMAPEQVEGREVTAAADVYAFAALAFELLSGRRAHPGGSPLEVMRRLEEGVQPDLCEAWPAAPKGAADVLRAGMAKEPSERPPSAGELVERLEEALAPAPAEPSPRRRRRFPVAAALAAAAVAAIAAAVVVILLASGGDERAPERPAKKPAQHRPRPAPSPPARAARAFYENAAAHRFSKAWELAGPGLRAQLGGYGAFRSQFSRVRSIRFERAETTAATGGRATVAIATTAVHVDHTEHCTGNVFLEQAATKAWRIERIGVSCS